MLELDGLGEVLLGQAGGSDDHLADWPSSWSGSWLKTFGLLLSALTLFRLASAYSGRAPNVDPVR